MPSLLAEPRREWSLMIFCARAMRGLEGEAQGREELSLLPERAPSEGPRSTAAVKSSSHPCLAEHRTGDESKNGRAHVGALSRGILTIELRFQSP